VGLINHLGTACFIQGLHNERIYTIVRSRGESILLSQAIEISLEEGVILSVREKSGAVGPHLRCYKCNKLGHRLINAEAVRNFLTAVHGSYMSLLRLLSLSCFTCGCDGHVAKNCRQETVCKKCYMKGHTENNCRVQNKYWTKSGNEAR
jgi:hypothetical protein